MVNLIFGFLYMRIRPSPQVCTEYYLSVLGSGDDHCELLLVSGFNGNKELVIQIISEILVPKANQCSVSSSIIFGMANYVKMA